MAPSANPYTALITPLVETLRIALCEHTEKTIAAELTDMPEKMPLHPLQVLAEG